jgi:hypothetical protein
MGVEDRRRVGDLAEPRRILGVVERQDGGPEPLQSAPLGLRVEPPAEVEEGPHGPPLQPDRRQLELPRVPGGPGPAEGVEQAAEAGRAHPRHHAEEDPVNPLLRFGRHHALR